MKTQTETAPATKSALMAMDWEQFAAFADANGWSTGSPERMAATIDLMIDSGIAIDDGQLVSNCSFCGAVVTPGDRICDTCNTERYGVNRFGGEVPAGVDW